MARCCTPTSARSSIRPPDASISLPPSGDLHIDILTRLGEAFRFDELERERVAFAGLTVSVVTPHMLYRMKKDTVRLKDRADAQALRERFKFEDE